MRISDWGSDVCSSDLNAQVLDDLLAALAAFDADEGQGCAVLTGSDKAFAAGADIKEMADMGFAEMYGTNHFAGWERFTQTRKPVIAAVAGYALGGGRSEEHTSELQSLMRISYAVFCLKKKRTTSSHVTK